MTTWRHFTGLLLAGLAQVSGGPAQSEPLFAARFTFGPAWDDAKPAQEQIHLAAHSANLARLRREGRIVIGARHGDTGLIVVSAADAIAARALFDSDPSIAAGIFDFSIDPFAAFYHGSTQVIDSPEAGLLRTYLAAFNAHDAAATAACLAEDVKWYSVFGDNLAREGESREAVQTWLAGYFTSLPTVRSTFLSMDQVGPIITVRERATWQTPDGATQRTESIGVYQVHDGLIRRVWYYPAQ